MGRQLRIKSVALTDASEPHRWEFPKGVTVIVGDSGGGKTSLLNLVKYGLGGKAPITEAIEGAARGVVVEIQVGSKELVLSRSFHERKSVLTVAEGDTVLGEFAASNGQKQPWISDLLLTALGIPTVRVPTSRTAKSHGLASISFQDVFAYCYLDQDAIDQETVYDKQSYGPGARRPWTFELLHGIIDGKTAELEAEREELAEQTVQRQQQLESVERFVQAADLPASAAEIARRIDDLSSEKQKIEAEIASTESDARTAVAEQTSERDIRDGAEDELRDARRDLADLQAELGEVRRAANQIQRDLDTAREGDAARQTLEPLPYLVCPRCEQSLEQRETLKGHCVLCQQAEPEASEEVLSPQQLIAQLEETRALAGQLEDAVVNARARVERLRAALAERRQALAVAKDSETEPFRARLVQLQEHLGRTTGERAALAAGLPIEKAVETERMAIASGKPKVAELTDQAHKRREDLSVQGQARVEEVSRLFSEILHAFSLPWLETAEVDRKTYLPLVNGLGLKRISSGGMKTTTNVAYYLAVFVTGLRESDTLTPSFLMLDSIRKDSGSGAEDLARSDRIYSYLQTLQELRVGSTPLARDFQLFVVDNDLPSDFERTFNTMRIDPNSPLVRGIA